MIKKDTLAGTALIFDSDGQVAVDYKENTNGIGDAVKIMKAINKITPLIEKCAPPGAKVVFEANGPIKVIYPRK